MSPLVLAVNAGSSTLRLGLFDAEGSALWGATTELESGWDDATLVGAFAAIPARHERISAVGHRFVYGGFDTSTEWLSPVRLQELRRIAWLDPTHTVAIRAYGAASTCVDAPQAACFDSGFHRTMPDVAQRLPLPRRFESAGIRRHGFHGLSCESIMTQLRSIAPGASDGRVIVAHLGSGASLTAIHRGRSIDTTMGFSPTGGVMMATRCGDLDPSILLRLLTTEHMTPTALAHLVNFESGLLGVSDVSGDVRTLLAIENTDDRARDALGLFCHRARRALGGLMLTLGGLDTVIFTGGIGVGAAAIRERICARLEAFGIALDARRNAAHDAIVSAGESRVVVRVMRTDENAVIARHVHRLLAEEPRHAGA